VLNKHSIKGPATVPLQRILLVAAVYDISHSGFCRKRIWWQKQTLGNLLTLGCRYLPISLAITLESCARSCIPPSQLPRSEQLANLRAFLSQISVHPLSSFCRDDITLVAQILSRKILSRCSQVPPCENRKINYYIQSLNALTSSLEERKKFMAKGQRQSDTPSRPISSSG
jgi:hypothetical protein